MLIPPNLLASWSPPKIFFPMLLVYFIRKKIACASPI